MDNIIITLINSAGFNESDELIEAVREHYEVYGVLPSKIKIRDLYIKGINERTQLNKDIIGSIVYYASEASGY